MMLRVNLQVPGLGATFLVSLGLFHTGQVLLYIRVESMLHLTNLGDSALINLDRTCSKVDKAIAEEVMNHSQKVSTQSVHDWSLFTLTTVRVWRCQYWKSSPPMGAFQGWTLELRGSWPNWIIWRGLLVSTSSKLTCRWNPPSLRRLTIISISL